MSVMRATEVRGSTRSMLEALGDVQEEAIVERAALLIIALLRLRSPCHVRLPSSLRCPFAEFANVQRVVSQAEARAIGGAI
jgi:hypothetical protein